MSSFSYKGILSILVSVFLVSGIVYASSTIISVQTQSIAQGDVIANGWFQEVNDSILSQRTGINTLSGQIQTLSGQINGSIGSQWSNYPNNTSPTGIYYPVGNVGIGVMPTDSTKKLVVQGDSVLNGNLTLIGSQSNDNFYIRIRNNSAIPNGAGLTAESSTKINYFRYNFNLNQWQLYNSGGSLSNVTMVMTDSGNLGIGTTNPAYKLDVASGTIRVTNEGDQANLLELRTERRWCFMQEGSGAGTALKLVSDCGGANNNKGFIIQTTGNVGIGTTTPGQKLSVAGTIESTSGGYKFPDGTVQTTAGGGYNIASEEPGNGYYYLAKVDNTTGLIDVKYSNSSSTAFNSLINPGFPNSGPANYSLSMYGNSNYITICRMNTYTASTVCKVYSFSSGNWYNYTYNPF